MTDFRISERRIRATHMRVWVITLTLTNRATDISRRTSICHVLAVPAELKFTSGCYEEVSEDGSCHVYLCSL